MDYHDGQQCSTYFWCVVFIDGPISNRFNGMCTLYTHNIKIKCFLKKTAHVVYENLLVLIFFCICVFCFALQKLIFSVEGAETKPRPRFSKAS